MFSSDNTESNINPFPKLYEGPSESLRPLHLGMDPDTDATMFDDDEASSNTLTNTEDFLNGKTSKLRRRNKNTWVIERKERLSALKRLLAVFFLLGVFLVLILVIIILVSVASKCRGIRNCNK